MNLPRFLLVLLVLFIAPTSFSMSHQAHAQTADVSVLYVSPVRTTSTGQSFTVAVSMNLSATDGISGYDIVLGSNVYNDTLLGSQVLSPLSIRSGNVFEGRQNVTLTNCVNGSGSGCDPTKGDGMGAVHLAAAVLGDPVCCGQSVTLFYVDYSVVGTGVTLLKIGGIRGNDNVTYSPLVSGYGPNTTVLSHLDYDGIFSNNGLAAFFNVASPATRIVGVPISYDASASFNSQGRKITGYQWDFGDGNKANVGPVASHVYDKIGSYSVTLNVTDGTSWRSILRTLTVGSSLGALRIYAFPVTQPKGASFQGNIQISLYNATVSTLVGSQMKPSQIPYVLFTGLKPGQYRVDFSGDGVIPTSKIETVNPGETHWDTVYIPVTVNVPSGPPDYLLYLALGIAGVGAAIGGAALLRRNRHVRKPLKSIKSKSLRTLISIEPLLGRDSY